MGNLRFLNIEKLVNEYNLNIFVETGTYYGDGIDVAKEYMLIYLHFMHNT